MNSTILDISRQAIVLATGIDEKLTGRIFGLDAQLLADACILAISVFVLFLALSYLVFNPARDLLKKRQDKIKDEMDASAKEKIDAINFKAKYDEKLKNVDKDAEAILSAARKKAIQRENEIIDAAKAEATRISKRANKDIELEKSKVRNEVKQEMIEIASLMAGKIIKVSMDETVQSKLIEETLKEMGDSTWQS